MNQLGLARALVTTWAVSVLLLGCQPQVAPSFHGTDMSGTASDIGQELALTDHSGKPRGLSDFAGKVVIVFFGYTQCPDVCPTNMTKFREVVSLLGNDSKRVQVIFVTVDPERDTQALLAQYVPAFHPDFLGLYGDTEQTAKVAKNFRIFYQKQAGASSNSYTVDHSTGSYVFDPAGKLRLYLRHDASAANIAEDVRQLLKG